MKLALIGYGKMGKAIEKVAVQKGHEVALKVTSQNRAELSGSALRSCDAAIEFTQPEAAFQNVMACMDAGVPVVCGTTGWNDKLEEARQVCLQKGQAFFHAPNFSIGVNIFFELNRTMARMAEHFPQMNHIWITETHHDQKKDVPSGTAVALARDVVALVSRLKTWQSYHAGKLMTDAEAADLTILPVNSLRVGDVAGIHEVTYESEDDSIQLIHQARGREGFAKGAVMAAEWLAGKKGVFSMKDLLSL